MKKIVYFYLLIFLSAVGFFIVLADSVEYNSFNIGVETDKKVFTFIPQGWAFFTRNPREAQVQLFKCNGDKYEKYTHYHSSYKNLFGLIRNSTRINYELTGIYSQIARDKFKDSESNIQTGYIKELPSDIVYVENKFDNPRVLGEYILVIQKLVPWNWSKNLEKEKMPCKIIRLKIY